MPTGAVNDSNEAYYSDRQHARKHVAIDAFIRPLGGGKSSVKVMDVSETGFRMNSPMVFDRGKNVFLTIPGFQALEAQIIWHQQELYGCIFTIPLHSAILDHISQVFTDSQDSRRL